MSQPSIITKSEYGGYTVTTKANDDPLSAVVLTPRHASTLWGARRIARKHQARIIKAAQIKKFREEIPAAIDPSRPLNLGLIRMKKG